MSIPAIRWLYDTFFRQPNPIIIRLLMDLRDRGWRVVAISGARENYRLALETWLRAMNIHVDELRLHRAGLSVPRWKVATVNELARGADGVLYLDDLPENLRGPFAENVVAMNTSSFLGTEG